jgi:hypothetical protein
VTDTCIFIVLLEATNSLYSSSRSYTWAPNFSTMCCEMLGWLPGWGSVGELSIYFLWSTRQIQHHLDGHYIQKFNTTFTSLVFKHSSRWLYGYCWFGFVRFLAEFSGYFLIYCWVIPIYFRVEFWIWFYSLYWFNSTRFSSKVSKWFFNPLLNCDRLLSSALFLSVWDDAGEGIALNCFHGRYCMVMLAEA